MAVARRREISVYIVSGERLIVKCSTSSHLHIEPETPSHFLHDDLIQPDLLWKIN